jgi:hypothetical protein
MDVCITSWTGALQGTESCRERRQSAANGLDRRAESRDRRPIDSSQCTLHRASLARERGSLSLCVACTASYRRRREAACVWRVRRTRKKQICYEHFFRNFFSENGTGNYHVHPLLTEGSTRFVWASRSPVHSGGCVVATTGGTVRLVNRVDKSDKRIIGFPVTSLYHRRSNPA